MTSVAMLEKRLRKLEKQIAKLEASRQGIITELGTEKPIECLNLPASMTAALRRDGLTTVEQVVRLLENGPDALLAIRNFGQKSLNLLIARLMELGYLTGGKR